MPRRCARKGCSERGIRKRLNILSAKNVGRGKKDLQIEAVGILVCKKHDPR